VSPRQSSFISLLAAARRSLILCEKTLLVLLLATMILLSFSQVVMRNLFSSGWIWAGDVLRAEVIWITFIGAALATEYKSHVRIDILSRLVRRKSAVRIFDMLADLFTAGVSVLLFVAAVQYVILMKPYSTDIMIPGIEEWMVRLVIPYAFAAMAIRCIVFVVQSLVNGSEPAETENPQSDE
jgi:TRAP-type C4-dicarboxylate transport system permease small subunit